MNDHPQNQSNYQQGKSAILGQDDLKLSEVSDELEGLYNTMARLESISCRLADKLAVVLCPERQETAGAETVPGRECQLGSQLQSVRLSLHQCVNFLSTLADRIRL